MTGPITIASSVTLDRAERRSLPGGFDILHIVRYRSSPTATITEEAMR